MVAGLAALGPGGLGPGLRRIGVPFGPTIVVARLPLWKTVQGGGAALWRAALWVPSLRGVTCTMGAGACRVVVCALLSLSRSTISGAGDWSLVRFNLFES